MSTSFLLASGYLFGGNIESSDADTGNINDEDDDVIEVGLSKEIHCSVKR